MNTLTSFTDLRITICLIFNCLFFTFNINAQETDSTTNLNQLEDLILVSDSTKTANPLMVEDLSFQIEKSKSLYKKKKLVAQLDTVQKINSLRAFNLSLEIDSVRSLIHGVPVVIFGDTVFEIFNKNGPYSIQERASIISNKVEGLVTNGTFEPKKLISILDDRNIDVMHDQTILFSVTEKDAFWLQEEAVDIAKKRSEIIVQAVSKQSEEAGMMQMLKRGGLVLLVIIGFYLAIRLMNKVFTKLNSRLVKKGGFLSKRMKIKNYEFISAETEENLIRTVLRIIKWIVIAIIVYICLPLAFSIFPSTKEYAEMLFDLVFSPFKNMVFSFIAYIPELITVIVIVIVTRYFVRFLRTLALEIEREKLQIPGFYADWAKPTFNLIKIIIYAFAFIVIFPYLPGSDSPIFQGVSVFLGILISLGSSSAIGNIIAGLVITYMRPFKIGDRVKVGETIGEVMEKTMLVTRVRTIKNEDVSIPNATIMNSSTINYSSSSEELGLILHTTVTIGYDVPWREVHEMLLGAVTKADLIKTDPKPFILQTSLDDFYVSYQVNAYTNQAGKAAKIYSDLHANIQDAFNEKGIEILSPHYRANRKDEGLTIPDDYINSKKGE